MDANAPAQVPAPVAAHRALRVAESNGRLSGFGNIFRKEMGDWFQTRRWLVNVILWVLMLNAFMAFVVVATSKEQQQARPGVPPASAQEVAVEFFFSFLVVAGPIGVIISSLDEIVGEKQSGTAAWVLSKPVSRDAFILSKLAANLLCSLLFIAAIPGLIAYFEIWILSGKSLALGPFLIGLALAGLTLAFYLTLSIFMGVISENRGRVLAVGLGLLLGGSILVQLVQAAALVLPLMMQNIASAVVLGKPLPSIAWIEVATTLLWCIGFAVLAPLFFRGKEL
jgi:ABC-2 type transport system permease protein